MATNSGSLQDRVALITGGAVRVGSYIAENLARAGCNLAIHYNSSATAANQLVDRLNKQYGVSAVTVQGDLNQPELCEGIVTDASNALGTIDILINNASIYEDIDLLQTSSADLNRNFNIHTISPFLLSRAFYEQLKNRRGAIINMLDYEILRPGKDRFAYALSKSALAYLTQSMALAMAPEVRVNGLALGAILPPVDDPNIDQDAWVANVPQQCWGNPEEIGELIVMLARDPGYINGEILHVDGGAHLL